MSRHMPTVVWSIRLPDPSNASNGYVSTKPSGNIQIEYEREGYGGVAFTLTRLDARMLARRITECLEATR